MTGSETLSAPAARNRGGLHVWPVATDIAIVVVLVVASLAQEAHQQRILGGEFGPRILLSLALVLPLAWRRRAPLTVFVFIGAVALGQSVSGAPILADAALLLAFYALAAYSSTRQTVIAGSCLEFGIGLAIAIRASHNTDFAPGFIFLTALVTAAGVLGVNVRIRRAYLAGVEERARQLELERDQQSQLAVAAERSRIAREMHDIIAHNLTVVIALTDGAALTVASDPARAASAINEASAAGRLALHEMRRVLGVLREQDESASLAPAPAIGDIDRLLETVRRTGLEVSFETTGALDDLGSGLELTIFRLVQEAVTNTVKHALTPTRIAVRVTRLADGVVVTVTNDGDAPAVTGRGQGLVGMRERVAVHGGRVDAGPTADGWQVTALLPVTSLSAAAEIPQEVPSP
jgi:signal transduction histidine kinase